MSHSQPPLLCLGMRPAIVQTYVAIPSLFRGLRKLVLKHWKFGSVEMYKSAVMAAQLKQLQKYVPDIQLSDLKR